MQVYRDLRAITARPSADEEARVPHRLYGHVDAGENYSVGRWLRDAEAALDEIAAQGRVAILVGGTGLYFKALLSGLAAVPPIPPEIRAQVRARVQNEGVAPLYAELVERDAATAHRVMPNDRSRICRALEVVLATGRALSDWHREGLPALVESARAAKVFLTCERQELVARIETRFAAMLTAGALGRSEGACRAQARSAATGDEGARRALADPPSQRRAIAGRGRRWRCDGHPSLCQATGHLVSQSDGGLALGTGRGRAKGARKPACGGPPCRLSWQLRLTGGWAGPINPRNESTGGHNAAQYYYHRGKGSDAAAVA